MKLKMYAALSLGVLVCSHSVRAEEIKSWLYPGIDFGFTSMSGSEGETDKSGTHFDLKLLYEYRLNSKWSLDAGIGWFSSSIKDDGSPRLNVSTKAGFAEADMLYRLSEKFSLAPTLLFAFGTDVSYSSTVGDQGTALFFGGQAAYHIPMDRNELRITFRALTDLTISERQVYQFLLGVQFGFGLGKKSGSEEPVYEEKREILPEDEPDEPIIFDNLQPDEKGILPEPKAPDVKISLGVSKVSFDFNSARLEPKAKDRLMELGKYLKETDSNWGALYIDGHTDTRGTEVYNRELSRERSESVKEALAEGGADARRMRTRPFGESQPLDPANTEAAHSVNRRVELRFYDVKDTESLQQRMNGIMGTVDSSSGP